ncbi:MAG: LysM peptidoglycan-binding domain-containing protein [Oscillospiraceae bacterium]|jgi:spore germination protein
MILYVVKQGDTIYNIARRYGVSVQRIISDNGLARAQELVPGQALIILVPAATYTVRPGDTLASIAARYGTTVLALVQNNPTLVNSPFLVPGQTLALRFQYQKKREIALYGYAYPYIQQSVLLRALPFLTYLAIFSYGFTPDGELIGVDDQRLINRAYEFRTAPVMVLSSIAEDGNFNSERASLLFRNAALQDKVLDNVVEVMRQKGYLGLDIDFEFIAPADRAGFLDFLEKAAARMHENGFFINTDLAPKVSAMQRGLLYESHDYGAVGAISDTVLLMTYEWGYTYGPPMAVAPLNRVREVVEYAVTEIPAGKIFLGIPNYGYDWPLPFERGATRAVSISNEYAVQLAARYGAEILYDDVAQAPNFSYFTRAGVKHAVWFEDVRSIRAKFDLMDEFGLLGGGYWNVMRPFAQNWAYVNTAYALRKVVV